MENIKANNGKRKYFTESERAPFSVEIFGESWYSERKTVKMRDKMIEFIRKELCQLGEETYRQFNQKLIPGTKYIIGVRMPILRKLAKEIAKRDWEDYLEEAKEGIGKWSAHEEIMLQGLVIGYAKMSIGERQAALDGFVPKIQNWSVCDSCCMGYNFMEKDPEVWFSYLQKYQNSREEFEVRFFIVSLLAHYVKEFYIEQVLEILHHVHHEGYYVKMAVAWAISVCYVKFPRQTKELLLNNEMDDFTQNKAIQKIRESHQVSKEEKEALNYLRREKQ